MVFIGDMAEREHAQIAPSGSDINRGAKRNCRRKRYKRIKNVNDSDSKVIRNDSMILQNLNKDKRDQEKRLFEELKISK